MKPEWCSSAGVLLHLSRPYMFLMSRWGLDTQHVLQIQPPTHIHHTLSQNLYTAHYTIRRSNYHTHIVPTDLLCTYWASDNGFVQHPKHVEPTKVQ